MKTGKREARRKYNAVMKSERWRLIRAAVIKRDGGRCARCGAIGGLEVHHLHYRTLGAETGRELITLCAACHAAIHGR